MADGGGGLQVLDLNGTEQGHYNGRGFAQKAAVQGCLAYVADYQGVSIYDISYFVPCPIVMPRAGSSW